LDEQRKDNRQGKIVAEVTFLSLKMSDRITVNAETGQGRTLLSLMREFRIPGYCRCEEGKCGSCAVKVLPRPGQAGAKRITLSSREKRALLRSGKLSRQQYEQEATADMPPLWRLACQFVVGDEPILVAF
jgi:ferredoxin